MSKPPSCGSSAAGTVGDHGRVLQLGTVQRGELEQRSEVEWSVHHLHVALVHLQLADQQVAHLVRHLLVDLEAHHQRRQAASLEDVAHRLEQVVLVAVELEVGAAGEPERLMGEDVHAREQGVEVGADHLFERHEAVAARQRRETRERGRDLDAGHALVARRRVGDHHREVERHRRDVRERVCRIDREWREDGEDLLREVGVEEGPVAVIEVVVVGDVDARGVERWRHGPGVHLVLVARRRRWCVRGRAHAAPAGSARPGSGR